MNLDPGTFAHCLSIQSYALSLPALEYSVREEGRNRGPNLTVCPYNWKSSSVFVLRQRFQLGASTEYFARDEYLGNDSIDVGRKIDLREHVDPKRTVKFSLGTRNDRITHLAFVLSWFACGAKRWSVRRFAVRLFVELVFDDFQSEQVMVLGFINSDGDSYPLSDSGSRMRSRFAPYPMHCGSVVGRPTAPVALLTWDPKFKW